VVDEQRAEGMVAMLACLLGKLDRVPKMLPEPGAHPRRRYRRQRERCRGCVARQSSYVLNVPFLRAASTHSVCACRRAAASFSGAITTWSLIACSWRPQSGHVYVEGF
jgi:hypothetical protein